MKADTARTSTPDQSSARVAIVDDETGVRQALVRGLEGHGFMCRPFRSGADLLENLEFELPDCIVLDTRMPKMDGLAVLGRLPAEALVIPIIMLTSHGEISLAVRAMRNGAADFVEKPVSIEQLAERIREHIDHSVEVRRKFNEIEQCKRLLAGLTSRESEIVGRIVGGCSNKEIARELAISPRTVEVHRANIFKKLNARNAVECALIFEKAQLSARSSAR